MREREGEVRGGRGENFEKGRREKDENFACAAEKKEGDRRGLRGATYPLSTLSNAVLCGKKNKDTFLRLQGQ